MNFVFYEFVILLMHLFVPILEACVAARMVCAVQSLHHVEWEATFLLTQHSDEVSILHWQENARIHSHKNGFHPRQPSKAARGNAGRAGVENLSMSKWFFIYTTVSFPTLCVSIGRRILTWPGIGMHTSVLLCLG